MCRLYAPMDGVPYPQRLTGHEPQYVPWGFLLVRPIGHPPRPVPPRAAGQRSRAYHTLLRVLKWGRYGHRRGPQSPEAGWPASISLGPLLSRPLPGSVGRCPSAPCRLVLLGSRRCACVGEGASPRSFTSSPLPSCLPSGLPSSAWVCGVLPAAPKPPLRRFPSGTQALCFASAW